MWALVLGPGATFFAVMVALALRVWVSRRSRTIRKGELDKRRLEFTRQWARESRLILGEGIRKQLRRASNVKQD